MITADRPEDRHTAARRSASRAGSARPASHDTGPYDTDPNDTDAHRTGTGRPGTDHIGGNHTMTVDDHDQADDQADARGEAHGDAIDGAQLLDGVHAALTRYVILPTPEAVDAVTLWIAATHAQPAWAHAPRLVIRAPEKRCGKSRLLDTVEGMCHAPLITVNASPAAIYRAIGTDNPPTLLVDEADTIFGGKNADANEDLRGLLNAGHQRNRPAIRWDHTTHTLEKIPTFSMAALAGIGAMPDTIEDRAVVIRMRRRALGEKVWPFRHRRDAPALRELAKRLAGWLRAHLSELERAEPAMPIEDRAADTWEPLVAVADLAGGDWPDRVRHAALALIAEADGNTQVSTRVRLLTDIRTAFTTLGEPAAVATAELLTVLNGDDEAPWSGFGPNGLTGKRLGDLLREFDISSVNVRFPVGQAKGYPRDAFADAWRRYCPAETVPPVPTIPAQLTPGTDHPTGTDRSVPPTGPRTLGPPAPGRMQASQRAEASRR